MISVKAYSEKCMDYNKDSVKKICVNLRDPREKRHTKGFPTICAEKASHVKAKHANKNLRKSARSAGRATPLHCKTNQNSPEKTNVAGPSKDTSVKVSPALWNLMTKSPPNTRMGVCWEPSCP